MKKELGLFCSLIKWKLKLDILQALFSDYICEWIIFPVSGVLWTILHLPVILVKLLCCIIILEMAHIMWHSTTTTTTNKPIKKNKLLVQIKKTKWCNFMLAVSYSRHIFIATCLFKGIEKRKCNHFVGRKTKKLFIYFCIFFSEFSEEVCPTGGGIIWPEFGNRQTKSNGKKNQLIVSMCCLN